MYNIAAKEATFLLKNLFKKRNKINKINADMIIEDNLVEKLEMPNNRYINFKSNTTKIDPPIPWLINGVV